MSREAGHARIPLRVLKHAYATRGSVFLLAFQRSSGATMRFEPEIGWGANAGLKVAQDLLEPELWLQLEVLKA